MDNVLYLKKILRDVYDSVYQPRAYTPRLYFSGKSRCGFSLIETVITIAVFTMVLVILTSSFIYFYRSNTYNVQQSFAVNSGRKGIENIVQDVRESTYSDEGSFPIVSISPNDFVFYSDIDKDLKIEKVRYYLENNILKKDTTEAVGVPPLYSNGVISTSIVSEYVRNIENNTSLFTYFDNEGNEILDFLNIADVVYVVVELEIDVNPTRSPNVFTIRGSATLRNLINSL
mgnify:CR=1 FL=1